MSPEVIRKVAESLKKAEKRRAVCPLCGSKVYEFYPPTYEQSVIAHRTISKLINGFIKRGKAKTR